MKTGALEDKMALAVLLMATQHAGQVDKGGEPYVLHPLHVMAELDLDGLLPGDARNAQIIALLHDVLEDFEGSDRAKADLWLQTYDTFGPEVGDALDALTRRRDEEYLGEYIPRLMQNMLARRVKLSDLEHNLDLRRVGGATVAGGDGERVQRYIKAREMIIDRERKELAT